MFGATHAFSAMYHGVTVVDGELYFTHVDAIGPDQVAYWKDCDGRRVVDFVDLNLADAVPFNRFDLVPKERFERNKSYRLLWEPVRLRSCLSMTVVVNGVAAGWVGVHRTESQPEFSADEVARAQSRAPGYIHAITMAHWLELATDAHGAVLIVAADGAVRSRSRTGDAWCESAALMSELRARIAALHQAGDERATFCAHGGLVRVTAVHGDGEALYCVDLSPADAWSPSKAVAMSPARRRVAEYAAMGATVAEIAASLDVHPETVRSHLKDIYRVLDVSSRVELAERVRFI